MRFNLNLIIKWVILIILIILFRTLVLKFLKFIGKYTLIVLKWCIKQWWFVIVAIGFILFYFVFDKNKLLFGGPFLIIIGISYIIQGYKDKTFPVLVGWLMVGYGIIAILAQYLLPKWVPQFILIFIILVLLLVSAYLRICSKQKVWLKIVASLFVIIALIPSVYTLNSVLVTTKQIGIKTIVDYFVLLFFIFLLILLIFLFIKNFMEIVSHKSNKKYFNNYFYFALSLTIFILVAGCMYITKISENQLRDFLVLLPLAFFTVWGGVSALKNIIEKLS